MSSSDKQKLTSALLAFVAEIYGGAAGDVCAIEI
jgi:hypothetical protein